jgi:hypothetical protein
MLSSLQSILQQEIATPLSKAPTVGTLKASTGPARVLRQRIQPYVSSGIPGVKKGRKVSLKALMSPIRTSYVGGDTIGTN